MSADTQTGSLTLNGGTLTLDYVTNASLIGGGNATTFGGGGVAIKGNPTSNTAQTLGNLTLTVNTGQSQLTVTGNGAAGSPPDPRQYVDAQLQRLPRPY